MSASAMQVEIESKVKCTCTCAIDTGRMCDCKCSTSCKNVQYLRLGGPKRDIIAKKGEFILKAGQKVRIISRDLPDYGTEAIVAAGDDDERDFWLVAAEGRMLGVFTCFEVEHVAGSPLRLAKAVEALALATRIHSGLQVTASLSLDKANKEAKPLSVSSPVNVLPIHLNGEHNTYDQIIAIHSQIDKLASLGADMIEETRQLYSGTERHQQMVREMEQSSRKNRGA